VVQRRRAACQASIQHGKGRSGTEAYMKLTIGVMGSSGGDLSKEIRRKVYRLGEAIAERDAILITGGGSRYGKRPCVRNGRR